jgi:hypothetical protein
VLFFCFGFIKGFTVYDCRIEVITEVVTVSHHPFCTAVLDFDAGHFSGGLKGRTSQVSFIEFAYQKDFISLFGAILRMRNLLLSFDEFKGKEMLTERDLQDYLGRYQDLRDEWKRKRENGESTDIIDDIVFEIELIKQIEINIDYILMLVKKYHDTHCEDKEVLVTIKKAIDASPELRSKKQLIETFIAGVNDVDDVMSEWHGFVAQQREQDLAALIQDEKLKPAETRIFLENSFREGEIKTVGTDIDRIMPPVSRFGGGNRAEKKQTLIDMAALASAYQAEGNGKLFWCGYGNKAIEPVMDLIQLVNDNGRNAYYVPTDGFDKTIYSLTRHCMSEDADFLRRIDALKKELGSSVSETTSKFEGPTTTIGKITNTNVFPITFPKNCYQFEVKYNQDEKPWDFCKSLANNAVMAIPINGFLYAWGEKDKIQSLCSGRMIGELSLTPFTRENAIRNGSFNELLLKTVTAIIGTANSLPYSKDKVWDTTQKINKRIGSRTITGYKGVRFALFFDTKYSYITATPAFVYDLGINLSHEEKKQFADSFTAEVNAGKPNPNVYRYIDEWAKHLFGNNGIHTTFPPNSATSFVFKILPISAILGASIGSQYQVRLPQTISDRRIVFKGAECRDTDLVFFNPAQNRMVTDFHPMRGLINNAPFDYSLNNNVLRSSISLGVICPSVHNQQFHSFLCQLNSRQGVKYNLEYVIPYSGFFEAYNTNLNIPTPNTNAWLDVTVTQSNDVYYAAAQLGKSLCQSLDRLSASSVDVAIIYIPKEYEPLTNR